MQILVCGAKRIYGTSAKTGNDFDMCNLIGLVPLSLGAGKSTKVEGYGLEPAEIPLDPGALMALRQFQGRFPLTLEVETDSRPYMGKLETFVIGVREPVAVTSRPAAAAPSPIAKQVA